MVACVPPRPTDPPAQRASRREGARSVVAPRVSVPKLSRPRPLPRHQELAPPSNANRPWCAS